MNPIVVIMLIAFFAVLLGVGLYSRRHASDVNGFVLGGRSVGPWLTAFAFGTSYFSAVIFVGYAGQFGWRFGLASTWVGLGNAFIGSLLPWAILGRRTRVMTQHLNSRTMPDFFGLRFLSPGLKTVAALIVFVVLIPYTASLFNGLSVLQLVKSMTGFSFGATFLDDVLFKTSIHSGSFAMLLGLVLVPLVSLFTRRMDAQQVERMFACYQETTPVPVTEALGEKK